MVEIKYIDGPEATQGTFDNGADMALSIIPSTVDLDHISEGARERIINLFAHTSSSAKIDECIDKINDSMSVYNPEVIKEIFDSIVSISHQAYYDILYVMAAIVSAQKTKEFSSYVEGIKLLTADLTASEDSDTVSDIATSIEEPDVYPDDGEITEAE